MKLGLFPEFKSGQVKKTVQLLKSQKATVSLTPT